MTLLIFLASMAGAIFVFETSSLLLRSRGITSTLSVQVGEGDIDSNAGGIRESAWYSVFSVVFPKWFSPDKAKNREKVIDLIRRSGYQPYGSVREYYVALMAEFGKGIVQSAVFAVPLVFLGMRFLVPIFAVLLLLLAYRRPYTRLKKAAKRRAELMQTNTLVGMTQLESLILAGVGVQESLRNTAQLGGPFCNLLGLLVARLEVEDPASALARVRQHVPDTSDINIMLFLRDMEDYFINQRPLASSLSALRRAVHKDMVNRTLARASRVKRTAGLFGAFAIFGMLASILLPVFTGGGM